MVTNKTGTLYLIPTPLGPDAIHPIPGYVVDQVKDCTYFIVETLKTGRRHIKAMVRDKDIDLCIFSEMNKHTPPEEYGFFLEPAKSGHDICLLSDAGSPTIADPGAPLVALAHRLGIHVVPMAGPSAIMLALMGSGFSGQQFTFHGYLSPKKDRIKSELKNLEQRALRGETQIFMETPYRNMKLLEILTEILHPKTQLCIACDITASSEFIMTRTVESWKKQLPDLHKRPCIFLLGS